MRLLLAALLLFGSEIILWTPPTHSSLDWILRGFGYLALATFTLDIAQRYLIRDGYDGMVLIAATALLHALLINPAVGWAEFPQTLLTRVMGGDALVQMILWGIFLAWLRGDIVKYGVYQAVGGLWLGIFWGFWMRWTPELRGTFEAVSLGQMALIAGSVFGLIVFVYYTITAQAPRQLDPDLFKLTPLEWLIWLLVVIILFLYQTLLGNITGSIFALTVILLMLCWLILWLRRDPVQDDHILTVHLPLRVQSPIWMVLLIVSFSGATYITFNLPLIDDVIYINQLWLMEIGSFGVGLLWLPLVASVIAVRSVDKMMREGWTV